MVSRSEMSEAASIMRRLAQDSSSDTVLVSCRGQEARFKLPQPLKGPNGQGAMVFYQGKWMKPQKFEEACGSKGKVWRRSLKVYTGLPGDEKGWLRMDKWLSRVREGSGHVPIAGEDESSEDEEDQSDAENEGSEASSSNSDNSCSSSSEGGTEEEKGCDKEALLESQRPAPQPQPQGAARASTRQATKPLSSSGPSKAEAADEQAKQMVPPSSSGKAAQAGSMGPPRAKPPARLPAARTGGAATKQTDASPSTRLSASLMAARKAAARGGVAGQEGQASGDAGEATPSSTASKVHPKRMARSGPKSKDQPAAGTQEQPSSSPLGNVDTAPDGVGPSLAGPSKNDKKRQPSEESDPVQKRMKIESKVKEMAEAEKKAVQAAEEAAALASQARKLLEEWQEKLATAERADQERQAAQEQLEQARLEQAQELERFKHEQACRLDGPMKVLEEKTRAAERARAEADKASEAFGL